MGRDKGHAGGNGLQEGNGNPAGLWLGQLPRRRRTVLGLDDLRDLWDIHGREANEQLNNVRKETSSGDTAWIFKSRQRD